MWPQKSIRLPRIVLKCEFRNGGISLFARCAVRASRLGVSGILLRALTMDAVRVPRLR